MSGSRSFSAFGLVVILCKISAIISTDVAPVLLFGGESSDSKQSVDALGRISNDEFTELILKKVGGSQPPIAVFAKDNLCVEELSQQKSPLESTEMIYLPSVEAPLSTFDNLRFYNVSREEKPDSISEGQIIVVPVSDLLEVSDIFKELRSKNLKTIGVITGASCSYSRSERTRRAAPSRSDNEVIARANRILLYSSNGIYHKRASSDEYSLLGQPTSESSVSDSTDGLRFDLTFVQNGTSEVTLRLQFNATATNYWYLESIEYEADSTVATLLSDSKVYFPFKFSYHCSRDTVFYNNISWVKFEGIQVEIDPSASSTVNSTVFSDGYDCIGFTSIPIWSGLFVTAILALIIIWGLTMIMDIRTMDRFDDPKGKTITIAASE